LNFFVLDCSVTMSWCFEDENTEYSKQILLLLKKIKAIVPCIWPLDVMNVLKVAENKHRITTLKSNAFVNLLNSLPIEIDPNLNCLLNKSILEITRKHSLSAYDAAYLEIAIRQNIPLISFDKKLCEVAKKEGISIFTT